MKKLLLALAVLGLVPVAGFSTTETPTLILAASDFQGKTDQAGARTVASILKKIKADGYNETDAVLFCGDYSVHFQPKKSESGITELTQALTEAQLGIEKNEIRLVQGNHDPVGTCGLSPSGANDPAHGKYGVFVINEDDYMWLQGLKPTDGNPAVSAHAKTVEKTARALDSYLTKKRERNFKSPIFIASHLPLHYSMRTFHESDCRYAKYIFDVLNKHGNAGLNIIFLYGHNHSNGWDNYLGGGSVLLQRGEKIYIADPKNREKCSPHPLAFTYMNAGYTGYFSTTDSADGADKTLSMTLFELYPCGKVCVKRYSESGSVALKARGVFNTRNRTLERELGLYRPSTRTLGPELTLLPPQ